MLIIPRSYLVFRQQRALTARPLLRVASNRKPAAATRPSASHRHFLAPDFSNFRALRDGESELAVFTRAKGWCSRSGYDRSRARFPVFRPYMKEPGPRPRRFSSSLFRSKLRRAACFTDFTLRLYPQRFSNVFNSRQFSALITSLRSSQPRRACPMEKRIRPNCSIVCASVESASFRPRSFAIRQ